MPTREEQYVMFININKSLTMLVADLRATRARLDAMASGQPVVNEPIREAPPVPPTPPSVHGQPIE